jgi:hypothetical protein
MMYRKTLAAALFSLFLTTAQSQAGVRALQQSAEVNPSAGTATFSITFDHAPNFLATDSAGRPVDSFQVEVDGIWHSGQPLVQDLTALIRGDEIHFGGTLPIRASGPPVDNPHAGGWGAIVQTIPFTTTADEVKFTAPLAALGVTGNFFSYRAFTMQDGQITASAEAATVPLPEALSAGACGLVIVGACVRRCVRR